MDQIQGAQWQYAWLPTGAVQALVCWLAATILRPPGKFAQAIPYFCQAQQAIDDELRRHHIGMQVAPPSCMVYWDLSINLLLWLLQQLCWLLVACRLPVSPVWCDGACLLLVPCEQMY